MTERTRQELFRRAAEAENGLPVSAGARVSHVHLALATGRAFQIDLSGIPDEQRAAVISDIQQLVNQARAGSARPPASSPNPPA